MIRWWRWFGWLRPRQWSTYNKIRKNQEGIIRQYEKELLDMETTLPLLSHKPAPMQFMDGSIMEYQDSDFNIQLEAINRHRQVVYNLRRYIENPRQDYMAWFLSGQPYIQAIHEFFREEVNEATSS